MTTFVKHDAEKPATHLLPPQATLAAARVLGHGAAKYGADNWRRCPPDQAVQRYAGAVIRHALAMLDGELVDPESGESHGAHIACGGLFLDEFVRMRGDNTSG